MICSRDANPPGGPTARRGEAYAGPPLDCERGPHYLPAKRARRDLKQTL